MLNAASGADTPAELSKSPTESQLCSIYSSRLTNKFLRDVSQKAPQDKVLSQRCRRVWAGFAEAECWNAEYEQCTSQGVNSQHIPGSQELIRGYWTKKTLKTVQRQIYQHLLSALSSSTSGVTDLGSEYWELSGALAEVGKVLTFKQKAGLILSSELLTFTLNKW